MQLDMKLRPGRGQAAASPEGHYEAEAPVAETDAGLVIRFHGEDGRKDVFTFAGRPCPQLHTDLAAAFSQRVGPTGQRRTLASARDHWGMLLRFLEFLAKQPKQLSTLKMLRATHLDRFWLDRRSTVSEHTADAELTELRALLRAVPSECLRLDVVEALARPVRTGKRDGGVPGYSDAEWKAIMTAARSDAVAIRRRIEDGERLLAAFLKDPKAIPEPDRAAASLLAEIAQTGRPPKALDAGGRPDHAGRVVAASRLFLVDRDLTPLIVLGVGLSERNGETIKELPAEHRLLQERAVAVRLTKRRRGKSATFEGVHWDTGGNASRQLHTSGGFYLLVHQLTRRSRQFSHAAGLWSIWVVEELGPADVKAEKALTAGHIDAFARRLGRDLHLNHWGRSHNLVDDNGQPLEIDLGRLKTAAEVRTTMRVGGHLPSASRTNSFDVSFVHYLRNDPRIREWADRILTEALEHAEDSARTFTVRVLDEVAEREAEAAPEAAAHRLGTTPEKVRQAVSGDLDTLLGSCLDFEHGHFDDGDTCTASFLLCLRCPNVLVTRRHLPMLLALRDWLQGQLDTLSVDDWVARHAVTWLILTRLVLPRFTDAQLAQAEQDKPAELPVDLLDGPREAR
ncbi:hypothetical protein [Streptomyces sp. NBC_01506]|uniref:hypothetical protein n=1 Tax=Streptomyces sp. NBC_01506 TaxID=2903887 RepID=UPI003869F253